MLSILTRTVICATSSSNLLRECMFWITLLRLNHGRLIHFAPGRGRLVWRLVADLFPPSELPPNRMWTIFQPNGDREGHDRSYGLP